MIRVSVSYPRGDGKKFDFGYYLQKHMPLVGDRLTPGGLTKWEVDKGLDAPQPAPFVAVAHLYFNSVDDFQKAFGAHAGEIMGDIKNYTDIEPQIQISEIVA